MIRRTLTRCGPGKRWSHDVRGYKDVGSTDRSWIPADKKHFWLEEFSNDYDQVRYLHPREAKMWYAATEMRHAKDMLHYAQQEQTTNHNAGLDAVTGHGPFEREIERRGIPVDKYPLPSTTAVKRVHEMTILKRRHLEARSEALMEEHRRRCARAFPSSWYDETDGPLNPHFLHFAQRSYTAPVTRLPQLPLVHAEAEAAAMAGGAANSGEAQQ